MDSATTTDIRTDLQRLQHAWEASQPHRAAGGRVALAGFRYQFEVFLLELVRAWLKLAEKRAGGADLSDFLASVESVSDFALGEAGQLIVAAQCKTTLRSGALIDALDEFLTILTAADTSCPDVSDRIRFRVFTNRVELADAAAAIERWAKKLAPPDADRGAKVAGRTEISESSAPAQELVALLVNRFACSEPLTSINKWVGTITRGIQNTQVLEHVVSQIWEQLLSMHSAAHAPRTARLYIWQDGDHPPLSVTTGDVLTGQRPDVRHLREGFFTRRTQVYGRLLDELRAWALQGSSERLRMFWLAGRSGSGKSVALLHLLAGLHSEGIGPITWLGHRVNLISEAFGASLRLSGARLTPLVAVDDPFAPEQEQELVRQWGTVLSLLHPLRQAGDTSRIPSFVVCDPTEQAYAYREQYGDEIDLKVVVLENESAEEMEDLRTWYTLRKGELPPAATGENVLLVQLFFEWSHHESLFDFSKRWRERLLAADPSRALLQRISCMLALNRLYAGYPASAVRAGLTPAQLDALSRLERDLHVGERADEGEPGYWLLHAHLANAIYENWYEGKHAERVQHLVDGVSAALLHGERPPDQTRPLWTLINAWLGVGAQTRVTQAEMTEVFESSFRQLQKLADTRLYPLPLWLAPVWVEIAAAVETLESRGEIFERAIGLLDPANLNESGLRLCSRKLASHKRYLSEEQRARFNDRISTLLDQREWFGWSAIAYDVIRFRMPAALRARVIQALETQAPDADTCGMCTAIAQQKSVRPEVIAAARVLERAPLHYRMDQLNDANYVLEPLIRQAVHDEPLLEYCRIRITGTRRDPSMLLALIIAKIPRSAVAHGTRISGADPYG
jgi:hypothetical protein